MIAPLYPEPRVLPEEAAERTGLPVETINHFIGTGEVVSYQGLVPESELPRLRERYL